jgi:uncharacterized protein
MLPKKVTIMQTFARLFGRSPFLPLQTHMEKVGRCVDHVPSLFEALEKKDYAAVAAIATEISNLEHEADVTKNDIRNNLPTTLFLPVSRQSLLEILSLQDSIADYAEDLGVLLTLKNLEVPDSLLGCLKELIQKNIKTFSGVRVIIKEMGLLLESSFGGQEAEKVRRMIHEVAYFEHETDLIQRDFLKKLFEQSDTMNAPSFFLWTKIIQELSSISDASEKLANRVRMTLEVK